MMSCLMNIILTMMIIIQFQKKSSNAKMEKRKTEIQLINRNKLRDNIHL